MHPDSDQPQDLARGADRETVEVVERAPAPDAARNLVVLFGPGGEPGAAFSVGREALAIGRADAGMSPIALADDRVSRRHAEIFWSELQSCHWVRDMESRNGTFLNGRRIAREPLAPRDVIRVGDTVLLFTAMAPAKAAISGAPGLVGRSRSLLDTVEHALRVAPGTAPVLILGETGTGKELLAELVHRHSGRAGPLIPLNCAALPRELAESELFGHRKGAFSGATADRAGLFSAAAGGTLFLDEIGELGADLQAKLLRALDRGSIRPVGAAEEIDVDVRVVAATNRDLAAEVERGGFRGDLFARVAESVVTIAPLRERIEDIEPLWRHFERQLGARQPVQLGGAAAEALALHAWPYNARELRQVVRGALLARPDGGTLALEDLPAALRPAPRSDASDVTQPPHVPDPQRPPDAAQLRQLMEEYRGSVKDVADFLGKDRKQVYRWLERHHIDPASYRQRR